MFLRTALVLSLVSASCLAGTRDLSRDVPLVLVEPDGPLASGYRPWLGSNLGAAAPGAPSTADALYLAQSEPERVATHVGPGRLVSPMRTWETRPERDRLISIPLPPAAEAGLLLLAASAAVGLFRRVRAARKG